MDMILGGSAAETEQTPDGHSADVKRLLRQQAALATVRELCLPGD